MTIFIQGAQITGEWYSVRPCKIKINQVNKIIEIENKLQTKTK